MTIMLPKIRLKGLIAQKYYEEINLEFALCIMKWYYGLGFSIKKSHINTSASKDFHCGCFGHLLRFKT